MKQPDQKISPAISGKCGKELDPDTPVGQYRVRHGDLVLVEDQHVPRPFLATVQGFYRLGARTYVRLGPPPGSDGPVARQSSNVRNIDKAWRRAGRPKNGGK